MPELLIKSLNVILTLYDYKHFQDVTIMSENNERPIFFELSIARYALELVLDNNEYAQGFPMLTLPVYKEPVVSIIIPVYNQWIYTYKCVSSVLKHTEIPYEVIVADDCSTDETMNLGDIIINAVHIRNVESMRFLLNCNNAAKYAKGKYICFLNNDTQVQPGWLSALVDLMERDESVGLAGSKLVYPDGRLQEAGGILWKDGSAWNFGRNDSPLKPDYNYVKEVDYISGASILVRKSLWDMLGGFDERFAPAYCEDSDLAFSIRQMGYKVLYQPKSAVVHFEGVSHGRDITVGQKQYQTVNSQKLFDKWKHVLEAEHFPRGEHVFFARDRSQGKKVLLFIDRGVPEFDKDAGSRTSYMYIKLCVEMGYHVIVIGADFYQRKPYACVLEQMGVEVLYGHFYSADWKRWLEDNGKHIDCVWLNRPRIAERYIDSIKKHTNARIIYNGVDINFVRLRMQYEITQDEALLQDIAVFEAVERKIYSEADVNISVSEKEITLISGIAPHRKSVVIPAYFYDDFPESKPFIYRKNILFVGGFAHLPNIDAVQWFVNEVMPLLPGVKFIVVGSNPPEPIKSLACGSVTVTGHISDEELNRLYAECRIVVIPLRYGAGVKGKTVEAVYNLIPVVSTSFGVEGLPMDDLIPPFDTPEAFAGEITRFMESDKACEDAAALYRKWIIDNFSKQRAVGVIKEILEG